VRITSRELAKICGVSIGTVDRALNNRPGINPETKERILRASRELGYRPHLVARSLKTGRTSTVGIVVYDLDNRFFAQLVNAIENAARESGYFVCLTLSHHDLTQERGCLEHLASMNVDGVLIVPTNKGNEFIRFVKSLPVPVVTIGNRISQTVPFVGLKDREAIRTALAAVAERGYTRVVYVSPPLSYGGKENIYEVEERYEGFREGVREHSLQSAVIRDKHFEATLSEALKADGGRTAIMCSSDIYALECLRLLGAWGLRVPDDVGLVGFDDIDILKYVRPSLTTIAYPTGEVAREAFAVLKVLMDGETETCPARLVEPKLVLRESL
jgi:DNA-binding LacI/PurR family transcriptional regulator